MDIETNLSIIIPNHNEKEIEWVYTYCRYFFPYAEIIVENDPMGMGKGYTVRRGLEKSTKDWVVFIDGDMDIHPREIKKLIEVQADAVIATKKIRKDSRQWLSIISRFIIRHIFQTNISDTQTGLKLFNRKILPRWKTDGFMFDVEILTKLEKKGIEIKEVTIDCLTATKKKGLKDIIKCTYELLTL